MTTSSLIVSKTGPNYTHGLDIVEPYDHPYPKERFYTNIQHKTTRKVTCDSCKSVNRITIRWLNLIVYDDENIEIESLKDRANSYGLFNFGIGQQRFPRFLYNITEIVLPEALRISEKCSCKINIVSELSPALQPINISSLLFETKSQAKEEKKKWDISDKPLVVQIICPDKAKDKLVVGIRGYYSASKLATIAQGYIRRQNKFIPNDITKLITRYFKLLRWEFYKRHSQLLRLK